jgi:hypothetical protein
MKSFVLALVIGLGLAGSANAQNCRNGDCAPRGYTTVYRQQYTSSYTYRVAPRVQTVAPRRGNNRLFLAPRYVRRAMIAGPRRCANGVCR